VAGPERQLEVRILGPLEVLSDGERVAVGGPKQGAVLGVLAVRAGTMVSTDALIEALWPDEPPATATTTVQVYVSRLRKLLGADAIVSEGGGYRLYLGADGLDARRFEQLTARARELRASGRLDEAAAAVSDALSLWRGPALSDFEYDSWAQPEINRLEEHRLSCLEERFDIELARGRDSELAGELETLVAAHPLRERLRGQLMLAQYRSGRQADALTAYQQARGTLVDELGIEPSPELQELNRQILNQANDLARPVGPTESRGRVDLPVAATPLIGRRRELQEVLALLSNGVRLLTLTGPGGIGKTRLALQAAQQAAANFPDGVYWIALSVLRDPALVIETIAGTLAAKRDLAEEIADRRLLLVLDNFEQVIEAAPGVAALLSHCPNIKLLVTSRELLRVNGEVDYPVPALDEPEAVSLFCDRSRIEPSEQVAELCARLDHLPLAVELAAARTTALSPRQILERLSQRFELLRGGRDADPRQQTLGAAIDWSYDLLSESEKQLFRRLSVFAGGATLGAAEDVAEADLDALQSLVEKSLVRFTNEQYWMLETIREYALERLQESDEAAEVHQRHALYLLSLSERVESDSRTGRGEDPFPRLDIEIANIRAAVTWAREAADPELLLRFATALWRYWSVRGYVAEGAPVIEEAVAAADEPPASALLGLCTLRLHSGTSAREIMPMAEAALEVSQRDGDDLSRAQAWNLVGKLRGPFLAQFGAADQAFEQGLRHAERGNHRTEIAESIWGLTLSTIAGPLPVAAGIDRAARLLRLAADEPEPRAFCLSAQGALEAMAGRFDAGRELLAEGTATFERLGDNVWAANNAQLSFIVEMLAGDPEAAARALRTSFDQLAEMGEQGFLSTIAGYLAHALYELGDDGEAERFNRAGEEAAAADDLISQILWRSARAKIQARRGDVDEALRLAHDAIDLAEATDLLNAQGDALLDLAEVLVLAGRRDEARPAAEDAARRFAAKGNVVSLGRATELAAAPASTVR
jgi:predicted ATPase/DNA-binding SARP family transcriptional activator